MTIITTIKDYYTGELHTEALHGMMFGNKTLLERPEKREIKN